MFFIFSLLVLFLKPDAGNGHCPLMTFSLPVSAADYLLNCEQLENSDSHTLYHSLHTPGRLFTILPKVATVRNLLACPSDHKARERQERGDSWLFNTAGLVILQCVM